MESTRPETADTQESIFNDGSLSDLLASYVSEALGMLPSRKTSPPGACADLHEIRFTEPLPSRGVPIEGLSMLLPRGEETLNVALGYAYPVERDGNFAREKHDVEFAVRSVARFVAEGIRQAAPEGRPLHCTSRVRAVADAAAKLVHLKIDYKWWQGTPARVQPAARM